MYRLFGWWYRWQACKMTAHVMSGWTIDREAAISPHIWSMAVFFEEYMLHGAANTQEDFGPKDPIELKQVSA